FVNRAVDAHHLPEWIAIGEKRIGDGSAEDHHGAGGLLVKGADEAAAFDIEERKCGGVLGLGPADDHFFYGVGASVDAVGVADEEAARADGGNVFHVGRGGADVLGVVVADVAAHADLFRHMGGIGSGRKSGQEVGARAQRFDAVLHEFVQALDD